MAEPKWYYFEGKTRKWICLGRNKKKIMKAIHDGARYPFLHYHTEV